MVQRPKLKAALRAVGEWFASLLIPPQIQPTKGFSGVAFGDVEEGNVYLVEAEAEEYRRHLAGLVEAVSGNDDVSPRAVEMAYQRAIFIVLDMKGRRTAEPKARREAALGELEKFLTGPLQHFRAVVPVLGLATEGLPTKVGSVAFAVFDQEQADVFSSVVRHWGLSQEEELERLEILEHMGLRRQLAGRPIAIVEVEALDWGAAEVRALREVRLTLDVINFFSALLPYNDAHLSLPGDATTTRLLVAQVRAENGKWAAYHFDDRWMGPLGELSLSKLHGHDLEARLGFAHASVLLRSRRNELQNRLVAALQWAGRATVDLRREEAFLLYAIALEAFLLAESDRQELTYRLRLRVAHLLGRTGEERGSLFKKVKHLYEIRSAIVHNGHYQVTEADLGLMRSVASWSLVRACTADEFTGMTTPDELAQWFEDKLLGSQGDRSEAEG
ncbi:MAG TPA: hypothetical protein VGR09_09510 [Gemmatimonadales bacterium]|nr:hypothetical protein [Gemmatimonadales bacterium]